VSFPKAPGPAAAAAAHGSLDHSGLGSLNGLTLSSTALDNQALLGSVSLCILAVDSGLTGGVAFYFPAHGAISAEDMPVAGGAVDAATLTARIRLHLPDLAIVELAASRPGQGVASTFKFGCAYGVTLGVITACGVPLHLVSPSKWKRHFALDADKEKARALALRLWPSRSELFGKKKDHGKAEAALLARYAYERIVNGGGQ